MKMKPTLPSLGRIALVTTALVVPPALGACVAATQARHSTPMSSSLLMDRTYPYEVDYEILGAGLGKACGEVKRPTGIGTASAAVVEAGSVGDPARFQEAKFLAIESVPGADNLLFIRAKVEQDQTTECVTVVGRGYRVVRVRAASLTGDRSIDAPERSVPAPTVTATTPDAGQGGGR